MRIYLDDIRTPKDNSWTIVRSFKEFTALISSRFKSLDEPTLCDITISFDHDLATEHYQYDRELLWASPDMPDCEESGYDAAKWLIYNNIIPKMFYVHSGNPVGAENILKLLNNWYKHNGFNIKGEKI